MFSLRRVFILLLTSLAVLGLAACSGGKKKEKFAYVEKPAEILYTQAKEELEKKRYDVAIPLFEEVERQHPYSNWARRSMLMKAFAYYQQNDYDESIAAVDQFIGLHPGNKDVPYAYYLKSMCFYEQIRDVGRDQDFTDKAVRALNDVVRRYPQTEYARDARLKLDLTNDHLAGKEMYVGRFYLRAGKHIAAINRFRTVIDDYQTTSHVPEALHRLVEAYMQIGVYNEAREVAAVLGHNYPGSDWYETSYSLMADAGLLEPGSTPDPSALRKVKKKKNNKEKLRAPVDLDTPNFPVDDQDIGNNDPVPPANR
ncbi:MAG: outer membrane protein assembly factor BamD [Pseudomonadota bacterium]